MKSTTPSIVYPDLWAAHRKNPTKDTHNALFNAFYPYLVRYTKFLRVRWPMLELGDMIQNGAFGLGRAIDKFDPDRGVKFETFSQKYIRGAIQDAVRQFDHLTRVHRKQLGDKAFTPLSMSVPCQTLQGEMDWESVLISGSPAPDEAAIRDDQVRHVLKLARTRERYILQEFFLKGRRPHEIGQSLGVTGSAISLAKSKAIARLRKRLGVEGPPPRVANSKIPMPVAA